MHCPECQFENREGVEFCEECGAKLELKCPHCRAKIPLARKFCGECGYDFKSAKEIPDKISETESLLFPPFKKKTSSVVAPIIGERKHVTVLFSDLSSYTALSERLDPEDAKVITNNIFNEISKIISKYEGFIEKYVGDAIMALFGAQVAYEDNPIRAIKAAKDIHAAVKALSPKYEGKVGQPLSMHPGINTGLVVTGELDEQKGTHGISGNTINLASRLSNLAEAGEIVVDSDTCRQAEGYFTFESLGLKEVKGKARPVQVYKVLTLKEKPVKLHRLSGLRSRLIGRKAELKELSEAAERLREGKGTIFSICGGAGTGKSRLVEEFKSTLNLEKIQWLEGHSYPYAQNIPYFPLIDLLNRVLKIQEGNQHEDFRERIESRIEGLVGKKKDVVPYIGGLYALSYPEVDIVSPEFWKSRLQHAALTIISDLAKKAPTIFCLEDLHWADPSFVELLRNALLRIRQPAIVLCVYRPTITLLTSHQLSSIGKNFQKISLQDLSHSESQEMLESLLRKGTIPSFLRQLVQDKAEGNPFYLEELVNSLIDSKTLIQENSEWKFTKSLMESDISSTIHGVISSRLDRLEKETKRVLQEASVIGRVFLYQILNKITIIKHDIDEDIRSLEQLDLIRTKFLQPDIEYIFKHALTQEVVYNGLLKKERRKIHERIGLVIEQLFQNRLPEYYETLAFHFSKSQSFQKAIDYLVKSAEKSYKRYALEESNQYYKRAFEILLNQSNNSKEKDFNLVTVLVKWAMVHAVRVKFKDLTLLLSDQKNVAESLNDKKLLGMYYGWFGYSLAQTMKLEDSYEYLLKALDIGRNIDSDELIAYACAWLCFTCAELGRLDEAITFGKEGREKSLNFINSDPGLFIIAVSFSAVAHFYKGNSTEVKEHGDVLLHHGKSNSDTLFMSNGYLYLGMGHHVAGDFSTAIEYYNKAINISAVPLSRYTAKCLLGLSYISIFEVHEAEKMLNDVFEFCNTIDDWIFKHTAQTMLSLVFMLKGDLNKGATTARYQAREMLESGALSRYVNTEFILGKFYLQLVQRKGPKTLHFMIKNFGFLLGNILVASKKAESHLKKAIEIADNIGAKGILGQSYLELGLLHKSKKRIEKSRKCISEAIRIFQGESETEYYLKQANEALASLQ